MKYLETRLRDMVEEKFLMGASSESTRTSGLWSRSWHQAIVSCIEQIADKVNTLMLMSD